MYQQKYISTRLFVFSKWSRKEYAIFASLGKLIKIGVLKADICQKALLKGLPGLLGIINVKEEEEDEMVWDISDQDSLQLLLSTFGISVSQYLSINTLKTSQGENPLNNISFRKIQSLFFTHRKEQTFFIQIIHIN